MNKAMLQSTTLGMSIVTYIANDTSEIISLDVSERYVITGSKDN